jgi:hypothetical protein
MGPLIFLLSTLALFAAFCALLSFERARGARVLAGLRGRLDTEVVRAAYLAEHVDWGGYTREKLRAGSLWLGHELARLALALVRAVERALARTLRQIRAQTASAPPASAQAARPFVQALSDFKEELKTSRPEDIGNPPG